MVFVPRILQEKCREQHTSLYLAFIDLTKAFDTVNRTLLWGILSKFGCTPHFLAVLREFHDGMSARVVLGGLESDPFMVNVGVKQGCVLAPVIFNLFLVAITLLFLNRVLPADSVGIHYRLDGSLFNIRRLQAATKVESTHVFELQYADDAALPSHTVFGLQQNLDSLTGCYRCAGLVVNVNKTEVLAQVSTAQTSVSPTFSIAGSNLNNVH